MEEAEHERAHRLLLDEVGKQYEAHNQPNPPGWEETVETHLKKQFWDTTEAINIICRLRPDRTCFSSGPGNHDAENFPFGLPYKPWELDATEQRFWYVRKLLNDAMKFGRIESVPPPKEPQSVENSALFGEEAAMDVMFNLLTPEAFLLWCYRNLDDIPHLLEARFEVSEFSELSKGEQITWLMNKRRYDLRKIKSLTAALALVMVDPEKVTRNSNISIELLDLELRGICDDQRSWEVLGFEKQEDRLSKRSLQDMLNPIIRGLKTPR
jgi:hypothetical protein